MAKATVKTAKANAPSKATAKAPEQLLHLVFGGELIDLDGVTFRDLDRLDVVGIYPNYASAYAAWKSAAQRTVDSAATRYFIVHLHKLLQPEAGNIKSAQRKRA